MFIHWICLLIGFSIKRDKLRSTYHQILFWNLYWYFRSWTISIELYSSWLNMIHCNNLHNSFYVRNYLATFLNRNSWTNINYLVDYTCYWLEIFIFCKGLIPIVRNHNIFNKWEMKQIHYLNKKASIPNHWLVLTVAMYLINSK